MYLCENIGAISIFQWDKRLVYCERHPMYHAMKGVLLQKLEHNYAVHHRESLFSVTRKDCRQKCINYGVVSGVSVCKGV